MPRIRQKENEYRSKDFRRDVRDRLNQMDCEQHDLAVHLDVCDGTVSLMLKNPDKITVGRLREVIAFLELSPEATLRLLGYKGKAIKNIPQSEMDCEKGR